MGSDASVPPLPYGFVGIRAPKRLNARFAMPQNSARVPEVRCRTIIGRLHAGHCSSCMALQARERTVLLYTGAPGFSERRERSLQHFVVHRGDMQSLPLCRVAHPRYANCRVLKRSTLRGRRVRSPLRGLSLSSNRGRDRGRITGCSRGLQARDYIVVTGPTFSDTCQ